LPGERNPPSAAEELAPPPQGESVLDASMMADFIVTKKGDRASAQKVHRNLADRPKNLRRVWSTIAVGGKAWGRSSDSLVTGFGGAVGGGFAVSVWTHIDGKIGADTAAWIRVNQG